MSDPLRDVADLLRRETGIAIKGEQLPSLEAALSRLGPGMSPASFLAARVNTSEGGLLLSRLIDEVTVKETFFLRQPKELAAIDWPGLLASARAAGRDSVRVWVAGCATGEEPYTLAMLASEAIATDALPASILATDISEAALADARQGRYGRRRLRGVDAAARERYFVREGEQFAVGPELRSVVEFRRHNLVGDEIPPFGLPRFDLIVCRNVLIYFDDAAIDHVISALERALLREGMLLLGAADRLSGASRRLAKLDRPPMRHVLERTARPLRRPLRRDARDVSGSVHTGPSSRAAPSGAPAAGAPPTRAALEDALRAADSGQLESAIEVTAKVLEEDPLNADAYFIRGLAELGLGNPGSAAESLRRALYVDPTFGLAAFQLGRAHEARGDRAGAARAYGRALNALTPEDDRHAAIVELVNAGDMAKACERRLRALASTGGRYPQNATSSRATPTGSS